MNFLINSRTQLKICYLIERKLAHMLQFFLILVHHHYSTIVNVIMDSPLLLFGIKPTKYLIYQTSQPTHFTRSKANSFFTLTLQNIKGIFIILDLM